MLDPTRRAIWTGGPRPGAALLLLGTALVAPGAGCTPADTVVAERVGAAPGGGSGAGGPGGGSEAGGPGGGSGAGGPGDADCLAPQVTVSSSSAHRLCTAALAQSLFRNALCTCEDADIVELETDGFDSRTGVLVAGEPGGSVGVNGDYMAVATSAAIGEHLIVAGSSRSLFVLSLSTRADLELNGPSSITGRLDVGRDAWLADTVRATTGSVHRDLYLAETAALDGAVFVEGVTQHTGVSIEPPCPCAEAELLDVGAIVGEARQSNDNAAAGLDASPPASPVDWSLGCGRYFAPAPSGALGGTVRVAGRAALMVEGDLELGAAFQTVMAGGAELDLFVSGNLTIGEGARVADPARPGGTRVYVGGGVVKLGGGELAGNLYAPRAEISSDVAAWTVQGAIFARSVRAASLVVHHDRAVLAGCEPANEAK